MPIKKKMAQMIIPSRNLGPVTYRFPAIEQQFQSDMHRPENLFLSDPDIVKNVCARKKPIGIVYLPGKAGNEAIRRVEDSGGLASRYCPDEIRLIALAIDGRVGDTFDLDALMADYAAWAESIPNNSLRIAVIQDIYTEMKRLSRKLFIELADFNLIEKQLMPDCSRHYPSSWMRCGLLLGYPPATTAAWILAENGVKGAGSNLEGLKAGL